LTTLKQDSSPLLSGDKAQRQAGLLWSTNKQLRNKFRAATMNYVCGTDAFSCAESLTIAGEKRAQPV